MDSDREPRSLEERVTRLETRGETRGAVVMTLVLAGLAVWALLELGVLTPGSGAPVG
jgi:hypothetical protein